MSWGLTFKDGKQVDNNKIISQLENRMSNEDYKVNNTNLIYKLTESTETDFENTPLKIQGMMTKDTVWSWQNHGKLNGSVKINEPNLAFTGKSFWHISTSYDQCEATIYDGMPQSQCERGSVRNEVRDSKNISVKGNDELWVQWSFKPMNNILHWQSNLGKWINIGQCHTGVDEGNIFSIEIKNQSLNVFLRVLDSDENKDEWGNVVFSKVPRAFVGRHLTNSPGEYGSNRWTTVRVKISPKKGILVWLDDKLWVEYNHPLKRDFCYWKQGMYVNGNTLDKGGELSYSTRNNMAIWFDGMAVGSSKKELEENLEKEKLI